MVKQYEKTEKVVIRKHYKKTKEMVHMKQYKKTDDVVKYGERVDMTRHVVTVMLS